MDMPKPRELGPPDKVEQIPDQGCPQCGSKWVFLVEAPIVHPALNSLVGTATFAGCPACGWRSKSLTVAVGTSRKLENLKINIRQRLQLLDKYKQELETLLEKIGEKE